MGQQRVLFGLAVAVLLVPSTVDARTWTDRSGNQMRGEFVRIHEGEVVILRAGRVGKYPFADFSEEDQDFVRETLEAKGQGHLVPPKVGGGTSGRSAVGGPDGAEGEAFEPDIEREWTDKTGRTMEARFVGMSGENVKFIKDGQEVSFAFSDLSLADQTYLKALLVSRGRGSGSPNRQSRSSPREGMPGGMPGMPGMPGMSGAMEGMPGGMPGMPGGMEGMMEGMMDGMPGVPGGMEGMMDGMPGGMPGVPGGMDGMMEGTDGMPGGMPGMPGGMDGTAGMPGVPGGMEGMPGMPGGSGYPGGGLDMSPPVNTRPSSSHPSPTTPSYTPPSTTGPPTPSESDFGSGPDSGEDSGWGTCSNCNAVVPPSVGAGDKCPSCGVYFAYAEDEQGNRTNAEREFSMAGLILIGFILLVLAFPAVKCCCGGG